MATKREKKVIHATISAGEVETVMAEYAEADAKLEKITSSMDVQITKIREKYAAEIGQLTERKEAAFEKLQKYALEKKEELFPGISEGKAKKKSLENTHGSFGFRTGTPALKTLKGFTWESVKNLLKEFLPDYVRTKEEANKEKLLAERDEPLPLKGEEDPMKDVPEDERPRISSLFSKVGIKVEQDETFFIDLKKEEVAA